jgi:tRNA(Ile)-lysidine synthase
VAGYEELIGRPEVQALLPRCRFPPPGTPVTCAVSGGADSSTLAVLAVAGGCAATLVHVDHGLRPGSAAEADVVATLARRLGAGFRAEAVSVEPGPNLEARARAARRGVLPPDALTGHTADDQAETVLLNLMRGSSLGGLAGMRADHRHPLLALRRSETAALCRALALPTVADPTNDDLVQRRSAVRHRLLPLLDELAGRDLVAVLARQAELIRDDDDLLESLAEAIDPTDARALAAAPAPLARRAVRRWLADPYPPDAATVTRVLDVAKGTSRACDVGAGRDVRRHSQRLVLSGGRRADGVGSPADVPPDVPPHERPPDQG